MISTTALTLGIVVAVFLLAVVFGLLVRSLVREPDGSTTADLGVDG